MVKKKYPTYYEMRYATLFKPIDDIQSRIGTNTTLIRYFFIEKELFAMVIDKTNRNFVALQSTDLAKRINSVLSFSSDVSQTSSTLQQLYNQLWKPLSAHIKSTKVVIVPDGILYNLSFELLTPGPIKQFADLASGSLLATHSISYHYSLFLVGQKETSQSQMGNFIAFAPGFLDDNKSRYVSTVKDSLSLDRSYLNLLPQPFSIDFASRTKRLLSGKAFVNDESTTSRFRSNAGGNKIIHIGTHAESNNIAPEFSRLIFSKSNDGNGDDNSIYLHEIYNCNLSSELAVLTACESGRPGFQDGEGMISLAHAFNYAGSESILTGLWSIDEKSSTMLMDFFYDNLLDGMDKDEALRQAKIKYLQEAKGRMLAPQYWAGLVLMGDTAPVHIKGKSNLRLWLIVGVVVVFVAGVVVYRRRKNV
jgi:CHAT domain-containing protein